jgi:hypothetical protein
MAASYASFHDTAPPQVRPRCRGRRDRAAGRPATHARTTAASTILHLIRHHQGHRPGPHPSRDSTINSGWLIAATIAADVIMASPGWARPQGRSRCARTRTHGWGDAPLVRAFDENVGERVLELGYRVRVGWTTRHDRPSVDNRDVLTDERDPLDRAAMARSPAFASEKRAKELTVILPTNHVSGIAGRLAQGSGSKRR